MEQDNSNKHDFQQKRDHQFYLSKLQYFQKRVQTIARELKIPLNYIFPSDFDQKTLQAKQSQQKDNQWIENYKDVIAFFIEGQINTTLMGLAAKFQNQFGGQLIFWMDLICSFAQNQKYQQNFRMWQVIDTYKDCLHLQKGEYEKNRKFRKLAKADLLISKNLITTLNQLKNFVENQNDEKINEEEIILKIEAFYKKHEESNRKIIDFFKGNNYRSVNLQFFQSKQFIFTNKNSQLVQTNANSKTKKCKKQGIQFKQQMITDFSIGIHEQKGSKLLQKIVGNPQSVNPALPEQKTAQLNQLYNNIGKNSKNMNEIRKQTISEKSKLLNKSVPYYACIIIDYSYFYFDQYKIPFQKYLEFEANNPFKQYQNVNYETNDYEEFEQIIGVDLDYDDDLLEDSEEYEDQQSLNTEQQQALFNYEDAFDMDEKQKQMHQKAIRINRYLEGKAWIFDCKTLDQMQVFNSQKGSQIVQVQNLSDLVDQFILKTSLLPNFLMPMVLQLPNQDQSQIDEIETQKLKLIIENRTFNEIVNLVKQNQLFREKFSKPKIHQFLNKHAKKTRKRVNGKNVYVFVLLNSNQSQTQSHQKEQGIIGNQRQKINQSLQSRTSYQEFSEDPEKMQIHQQNSWHLNFGTSNSQISNDAKSQNLKSQNSNQQKEKTRRNSKSQKPFSDDSRTMTANSIRLRERRQKKNYNIDQILKKLGKSDLQ